ncbi:hypothetical protein APTSU1_000668200 [Apodemus speciosus]|uniref:Uncharacterized protein n=1 Tax=Apodemus speciosus TaxID=105296 RepID=A0ABQ0EWL9_APOSI
MAQLLLQDSRGYRRLQSHRSMGKRFINFSCAIQCPRL